MRKLFITYTNNIILIKNGKKKLIISIFSASISSQQWQRPKHPNCYNHNTENASDLISVEFWYVKKEEVGKLIRYKRMLYLWSKITV